MKHFLLLLSLLSALSRNGAGQVRGQFVTAGGAPVALADVVVVQLVDSAPVKAGSTDSTGHYRIGPLPPGRYVLRGSNVGYRAWVSPVFVLDQRTRDVDLGRIVLQEEKRELGEVVVRAVKPPVQQSIEGTVVNVQNSLFSKGNSVLEVLERSPGVLLDHRNNSISLNGKSGVTVMIDGKLLHMPEDEILAMLTGMSADNIDKIELLTAPPSRYDASGSAGVINIVLKKNKHQGTTGSFSVNGGYGWGEKGGASSSIDHNTGKTDWYGSYSFLHDHSYSGFVAGGTGLNPALGESGFTFRDSTSWMSNNHNALAGFETKLPRGFTLGASLGYNNSTTSTVTGNLGNYTLPPDSVLVFNGAIHGRSHWDNVI
ncbi:MAG TPA: TonB-dependent receptor, partial [Puia sp.]|nr:TonB-dependent receptor [Puia sp.]